MCIVHFIHITRQYNSCVVRFIDYVWELEKAEYVSSNHQSSSKEQKASKTIQTQLESDV